MTTRSRAAAARRLPPELLVLVANALAESGAHKSLLEMTLMSRGARALLLPALLRDLDTLQCGGAWTSARMRAFLQSPADSFRHIKKLVCGLHVESYAEEEDGAPSFPPDHLVDLIGRCAGTLDKFQVVSAANCSHLSSIYSAISASTSITELSFDFIGPAREFVDELAVVGFPPRLRKLEIDAAGHEPASRFYECLESLDSLEEWKCNFEMSQPFRPPKEVLASKLTGFRVDSNRVSEFLELPGINPEKLTELEIPFVPSTALSTGDDAFDRAIEAEQLDLLRLLSTKCTRLHTLETLGFRMHTLNQLPSLPASWTSLLFFNPIVHMQPAEYTSLRAKIEASNVERVALHFLGLRVLEQLAELEMFVCWTGMRGFKVSVSERAGGVIEDEDEDVEDEGE